MFQGRAICLHNVCLRLIVQECCYTFRLFWAMFCSSDSWEGRLPECRVRAAQHRPQPRWDVWGNVDGRPLFCCCISFCPWTRTAKYKKFLSNGWVLWCVTVFRASSVLNVWSLTTLQRSCLSTMSCSMILETYPLIWPPLGEIQRCYC